MQPRGGDFADAYARAEPVEGWLTVEQARCLYDAAAAVPPAGNALEVGSHHGRSALVLAAALPDGARLTCVDPHPADWRYGAPGTRGAFLRNIEAAGLTDRVELRPRTSAAVRRDWSGDLHLVYVDGKHDFLTVRDDLRWAEHLVPGGVLLVHDAYSSLGVTTALLWQLSRSRQLSYLRRVGSLAVLERRPPSLGDRARLLAGVPWFVRNLVVKVLLRARARRVAALLGHHGEADPY